MGVFFYAYGDARAENEYVEKTLAECHKRYPITSLVLVFVIHHRFLWHWLKAVADIIHCEQR